MSSLTKIWRDKMAAIANEAPSLPGSSDISQCSYDCMKRTLMNDSDRQLIWKGWRRWFHETLCISKLAWPHHERRCNSTHLSTGSADKVADRCQSLQIHRALADSWRRSTWRLDVRLVTTGSAALADHVTDDLIDLWSSAVLEERRYGQHWLRADDDDSSKTMSIVTVFTRH